MGWYDIQQFIMIFCSGAAIWAFAGKKYKKAGFIIGLIGQPFWIYATFTSSPFQWGMFAVSIWFTFNYIRGLWNYK